MPTLKHKVFAYITHGNRLLVFSHPESPEAGIQVPAGTLQPNETPAEGVMREAFEETGLKSLRLVKHLGTCDFHLPDRDEVHRRHFFHIVCDSQPAERWRHYESDADDGNAPIPFEFFWVCLPDGVPHLAPGFDRMLPLLG